MTYLQVNLQVLMFDVNFTLDNLRGLLTRAFLADPCEVALQTINSHVFPNLALPHATSMTGRRRIPLLPEHMVAAIPRSRSYAIPQQMVLTIQGPTISSTHQAPVVENAIRQPFMRRQRRIVYPKKPSFFFRRFGNKRFR